MMWHLTLLSVKSIINKLIRRFLFCLLLIPMSLSYQNPFDMLLFQHVLMNVEDVMSQIISVKTAQSFKSINQLRLKKLSPSLIISFFVKILRHNIPAVIMMMIL